MVLKCVLAIVSATLRSTSYFGLFIQGFIYGTLCFQCIFYIIIFKFTFSVHDLLFFTHFCVGWFSFYTIYLYYFTRCMPSFSPTFRVFLLIVSCSACYALSCTHIYNWREVSSCRSDFFLTGGFHWRFYCQGSERDRKNTFWIVD